MADRISTGLPINALPQHYFQRVTSSHNTNDKLQQSLLLALQQIDKNFSECHQVVQCIQAELTEYNKFHLEIDRHISGWTRFFELFTDRIGEPEPSIPLEQSSIGDSSEELESPADLYYSSDDSSDQETEFSLDRFPLIFRSGQEAYQLQTVYDHLRASSDGLTMEELVVLVPDLTTKVLVNMLCKKKMVRRRERGKDYLYYINKS